MTQLFSTKEIAAELRLSRKKVANDCADGLFGPVERDSRGRYWLTREAVDGYRNRRTIRPRAYLVRGLA